jgi:hypothetical protein
MALHPEFGRELNLGETELEPLFSKLPAGQALRCYTVQHLESTMSMGLRGHFNMATMATATHRRCLPPRERQRISHARAPSTIAAETFPLHSHRALRQVFHQRHVPRRRLDWTFRSPKRVACSETSPVDIIIAALIQ